MRTKRPRAKDAFDRIPVEIWREIASLLSRSQHKALMHVPHVLGKLSSEIFYRDIVLYYGTLPLSLIEFGDLSRYPVDHQLERWHAKRCRGIISRILQDPQFALRVRTLKVYASVQQDPMSRQMTSLSKALPNLKRLEHFACHGTHYALHSLVAALLPTTVPQLKGVEIKYVELNPPEFPVILADLESITIESVADAYQSFLGSAPSLRDLRIGGHQHIAPLITPLTMGKLTHLELYRTASYSTVASFPFEIVLRDGAHLESLRAENLQSSQFPSVHFRRYSHSLPYLKRFGISFSSPMSPADYDLDLFPAICDFLRNKSGLVTLELIAPSHPLAQRSLGFGKGCWDFLPILVNLRCLSMTLTDLGDSKHCTQFIPRSVTSLTLLGKALGEKVISAGSQAHWPNFLRFLHLDQYPSDRAARKIATYVPSVYVVRLQTSHYNVVSRMTGRPVKVEQWTKRTEEYFWREQLEAQGCEDRLLYMLPSAHRFNPYYM